MTAADTSDYLAIHRTLRRGTRALALAAPTLDPADRVRSRAFGRYWHGYAGEVLLHHTVEDDIFFPALVERVAVAERLIAQTDADHAHLDDLMVEITEAVERLQQGERSAPACLAARCAELADHMDAHLAFEDADIVPLFARHFTAEEYAALHDRAKRTLKLGKQAAFTVAFVAHWMDPEDVDLLLATAPLPFKALLWATRRRHARLAASALGPAADRALVAATEERAPEVPAAR